MVKEQVHTAIILISNTYFHEKYFYGGYQDDYIFQKEVMKLDDENMNRIFKISYNNVGATDEYGEKISISLFRILNKDKNDLIAQLNHITQTTEFEYCHVILSGYYKKTDKSFVEYYTNNHPLETSISLYEILNILETFSLEYIYVYIDCCNLGTSKQVYNEEYFKERNIIILRSQFRCKNKRSQGDLVTNFCKFFKKYYYGRKLSMTYNFSGNFLLILSIIKEKLKITQMKFLESHLTDKQWASFVETKNDTSKIMLNEMCLDLYKLYINRKFYKNFESRVYSYRRNINYGSDIDEKIEKFFKNLGSYCVLSINDIIID